jgi:hypothetical protein
LSQPAASQEQGPASPPEPIDPDCHPLLAETADPAQVEQTDGLCPPQAQDPPAPDPKPDPDPGKPEDPGGDGQPGPEGGHGPGEPAQPDQGTGQPEQPRPGPQPRRPAAERQPSRDYGSAPRSRPRRERNGGTRAEQRSTERAKRRRADRRGPGGGARSRQGNADSGTPGADLGGAGFGAQLPGPDPSEPLERGIRVPRFLQPIYHDAAARYGIRWEILAAINEVETAFGQNLNVSWAGATGWMQFMPSTWRAYGTDGNRDGVEDPYDPVDAIYSAARYLKAAGFANDVRAALFAYNHATWYVEDVLRRARSIALEHLSPSRAQRLRPAFVSRLMRTSERHRLRWSLVLAVLRARGRGGAAPATGDELRALARRLVRLGARKHPRLAIRRLARGPYAYAELHPRLVPGEPGFVERVVTLAHYNKAVGLEGLRRGLKAIEDRLARRVLQSHSLEIYPGGRSDVESGVTSARVLALLAYLGSRYDQVGVTSLTSGHGFFTASGNISAHSYGNAVDVASLNGTPILSNQERGGLTEQALWNVLLLPDELGPDELISLLDLPGPSFPLADHADHVHVGY